MEYTKATPEMIELCRKIITRNHPHLRNVRVAIVCRDKAPTRHGFSVPADVSRPSPRMKPLLDADYDFVMCIALDTWDRFTEHQRAAMVDHELCHCRIEPDGTRTLVGHDLEEFACIVERYGLWREDGTEDAMRQALLFHDGPTVEAPTIHQFAASS